jgi:hypothetical protein
VTTFRYLSRVARLVIAGKDSGVRISTEVPGRDAGQILGFRDWTGNTQGKETRKHPNFAQIGKKSRLGQIQSQNVLCYIEKVANRVFIQLV